MKYKLRFVQKFQQDKQKEFLDLEKKFIQLEEEQDADFPTGVRYIPLCGYQSENTLIWECEFESLKETTDALEFIKNNDKHDKLFQEQVQYFKDSYVEIYKVFDYK